MKAAGDSTLLLSDLVNRGLGEPVARKFLRRWSAAGWNTGRLHRAIDRLLLWRSAERVKRGFYKATKRGVAVLREWERGQSAESEGGARA